MLSTIYSNLLEGDVQTSDKLFDFIHNVIFWRTCGKPDCFLLLSSWGNQRYVENIGIILIDWSSQNREVSTHSKAASLRPPTRGIEIHPSWNLFPCPCVNIAYRIPDPCDSIFGNRYRRKSIRDADSRMRVFMAR